VYQYFTIYRRYFVSVVCVKQYAPQNVVLAVILWQSVLLVEETGVFGENTDLS
jgi:hypothetical protein